MFDGSCGELSFIKVDILSVDDFSCFHVEQFVGVVSMAVTDTKVDRFVNFGL